MASPPASAMTLQWIGLGAAWLASGYRLWVSVRQPPTIWRTAFTVGILCAALGVTCQSFTQQIDARTAPSVGSLVNHVVVIVGLASVQVYVATLRRDNPPAGLLRRVLIMGVAAVAVTVVSWSSGEPFHSGEAEHFAVYANNVWVSIYFLTFWALIAVTMITVAKFCLVEQRGARPEDRARVVSLALIGLGAVGGVLYAVTAAAGVTHLAVTGVLDEGPLMASSRLIGPSIGLLGVGILALLVVPPLDAAVRARRRRHALRPLWEDLQRAVPSIRLSRPERQRLSDTAAVERAVIEIRDALNALPIDVPAGGDPERVAERLVEELIKPAEFDKHGETFCLRPVGARRPAATFLPTSRTQREDTEQVYAMALAYRRLKVQGRSSHASDPAAVPGPSA